MNPTLLVFTLLIVVGVVSASYPDAPLCVIPSISNPAQTVNLTNIAPATYHGQLATNTGLQPIQINFGWCKPVNSSSPNNNIKCQNQTQPWIMTMIDSATGKCLQGFTAVVTPGMAISNTTYSFSEWAPYTGDQATVEVTCDTSVPAGTAKLANVVTNPRMSEYVFKFNSSTACVGSSVYSSGSFFDGLKRHH